MSGVCLLEFKASPLAVSQHAPVSGFRLLLRGVDDMELIRAPSWWTPARLQTALVLLLAIAVLAVLWVLGLRRIIARQTVVIAESTAQSVLHEERARLARELHDTLEQHLTGVRMQIETAKSDLAEAPEAVATSLESALGMLVFSQEEARRSVWNLRNAQLIHQGLAVALGNLLPLDPQGPKLRIEVTGSIRRLSAPLEFHLLRIAQEAVTNALKHSGASEIFVNLHFTNSTVTLAVTDDGQGFEPAFAKGGEEGHFGLLGIHERANKIHAQVLIESRPGGGVRIEVSAPTAPPTAGSSP
jgi:signal transduction histidine kinase